MVELIRRIEQMRGAYDKTPMPSEMEFRSHIRRSVSAATDLAAGDMLAESKLAFLRPEIGIPMDKAQEIVGRKLLHPKRRGEVIRWEDLDCEADGGIIP